MRTFFELFAGAGGMSLGLMEAGFVSLGACDFSKVAVENYRRNVSELVSTTDLSNPLSVIPELVRLNPLLVAGGPPCQDFSNAGTRLEGNNASLTVAFATIVATVGPEWVMMENVIPAEKSHAYQLARQILKGRGYGISIARVDASKFGVAQRRRRLILIGRLGERDDFISDAVLAAASHKSTTLLDLFGGRNGDDPLNPEDEALVRNGFVYSRPLHAGRGVRSVDEPMTTITRTSWERPTHRYLSNPHPADPICASQAAVLTMRQLALIQGFPSNYEWHSSAKRDVHQMVANAVPPPLAQALGEIILARHDGINMPATDGRFTRWLRRHGKSPATARKMKSGVVQARRFLGGRLYSDNTRELAALEQSTDFQGLSGARRSVLRRAVALYAEYLDHKAQRDVMRRNRANQAALKHLANEQ